MSDHKDVHTEHCCSKHGCKYAATSRTCTVVDGWATQSHPCEYCDQERRVVARWLPEATADELRDEWRRRGMNLDRAEHTFPVGLSCPQCGQDSLFGFTYRNEKGEHMHTRYVCNFWRSGVKEDLSGMIHERCDWMGWSVPGWDDEA